MIPNFNITKNKPGIWERIIDIVSEIPFFIRFVIITKIIFFIINLFTRYFSFYLSNIPIYTIGHYQFWRLITTSFITTNIINLLFAFVFWVKDAISLEKTLGTIRYIFIFLTNSLFINIIYCCITYFIKNYIKNKPYALYETYKTASIGLWPIIICEMTLLCFNNPDSKIIFIVMPFPIKAKYYPIFIIIVFTLINNFRLNFQIISGFLYGIIYYYLFQNRLNISDDTIKKLENSYLCKGLTGLNGFISIDNINNYNPTSGEVQTMNSIDSHNQFSPFHGKGIQVGSNNDYVAVHEQSQNSNTLDEINTENKN